MSGARGGGVMRGDAVGMLGAWVTPGVVTTRAGAGRTGAGRGPAGTGNGRAGTRRGRTGAASGPASTGRRRPPGRKAWDRRASGRKAWDRRASGRKAWDRRSPGGGAAHRPFTEDPLFWSTLVFSAKWVVVQVGLQLAL
ncbi:hypothetical protein AB0A99_15665, partial [Streptomyces fradiae]